MDTERSTRSEGWLIRSAAVSVGFVTARVVEPPPSRPRAVTQPSSAAAVDTNFIPMNERYDLTTSAGTLLGNILTTPLEGGDGSRRRR